MIEMVLVVVGIIAGLGTGYAIARATESPAIREVVPDRPLDNDFPIGPSQGQMITLGFEDGTEATYMFTHGAWYPVNELPNNQES